MTVDDIMAIPMTQVAEFAGDELAAFCDLLQYDLKQDNDWELIRSARCVLGVPRPPLFLDEINRLWIGHAMGRDWLIDDRSDQHTAAVERSFQRNKP